MEKETYLHLALREFKRMKALADGAVVQVTPDQFFTAPAEGDNSIAIIVKHVGGNLLSRWTDFLTTDGEKPGRNRDTEFEIGSDDTHAALLQQWEMGWSALFNALDPLTDKDLDKTISIRGEPLSVLQAINRQLTHYSYHVGQIVYVAKHHAGNSWHSLSIPRGQSAQFNTKPAKYVERP